MCVFNLMRASACKPNGMPVPSKPIFFFFFLTFFEFLKVVLINTDDVSKTGCSRPS